MKKFVTLAAAWISGGTLLLAASPALAHTDIALNIGVPAVHVVQPEPAYQPPRPLYVRPAPLYIQPQPHCDEQLARREWREREWQRLQWRERQWRERLMHARRDSDRDGIPDRVDVDRDGDGVPNRYDRQPDNGYRY